MYRFDESSRLQSVRARGSDKFQVITIFAMPFDDVVGNESKRTDIIFILCYRVSPDNI